MSDDTRTRRRPPPHGVPDDGAPADLPLDGGEEPGSCGGRSPRRWSSRRPRRARRRAVQRAGGPVFEEIVHDHITRSRCFPERHANPSVRSAPVGARRRPVHRARPSPLRMRPCTPRDRLDTTSNWSHRPNHARVTPDEDARIPHNRYEPSTLHRRPVRATRQAAVPPIATWPPAAARRSRRYFKPTLYVTGLTRRRVSTGRWARRIWTAARAGTPTTAGTFDGVRPGLSGARRRRSAPVRRSSSRGTTTTALMQDIHDPFSGCRRWQHHKPIQAHVSEFPEVLHAAARPGYFSRVPDRTEDSGWLRRHSTLLAVWTRLLNWCR